MHITNLVICIKVNYYFVGIVNSWIALPTKYTKLTVQRKCMISQYLLNIMELHTCCFTKMRHVMMSCECYRSPGLVTMFSIWNKTQMTIIVLFPLLATLTIIRCGRRKHTFLFVRLMHAIWIVINTYLDKLYLLKI